MSHRVQTVAGHLSSSSTPMSSSVSASPVSAAASPKLPSDIVVISALRTPICKARRGGLKDTSVEDLLAVVIKATIERTKIDPSVLGDIVVGSVLGLNVQRANEARIGAFLAGVPSSVPLHVVNRQCSSGLQAVAHVAASIRAGYYEVGLACGLESMTQSAFTGAWQGALNPNIFLNADAKNCLLPMGITSENVASKYGVSRKVQDELSARSHQNAARAIREGKFKAEIVPVPTKLKDANGVAKDVVIDTDDGVRADTTAESLSKLPAVFQKGGSTTAGNSSQVSDGAAAVLVSSRAYAEKHKLPVLGVFRSFAVTGVPPEIMGIGPAAAIPLALAQAGLTVDDIDVFEINEAFASQAAYCVQHLKIPPHKVNPNGGAIAIGHPLGATGARLTATLLHEMHRSKRRYGVVSMCIGSGMGAAAVYEVQQ